MLLLRAASIVIDRNHSIEMLNGLDREVGTISFSLFPIAMLMGFIALAVLQALILFPHAIVAKAQVLAQAGILNVVLAACLVVGAYFTWFGYLAADRENQSVPVVRP